MLADLGELGAKVVLLERVVRQLALEFFDEGEPQLVDQIADVCDGADGEKGRRGGGGEAERRRCGEAESRGDDGETWQR